MSSLKLVLAFVAIALITSSAAQRDSFGEGRDLGPFGVPQERFNELMESPNATSKYPIAAPDISAPYSASGSAGSNEWYWSVSVVADIPMTESNTSTAELYPNQTFTGTQIRFHAPADAMVDETWLVCVLDWRMDMDNFPAKLRQDDGSCRSALSEQCIRGVEAATVQRFKENGSIRPCLCPDYLKISGCSGEEVDILKSGGSCGARTFNSTDFKDFPDDGFRVVRYGGIPHDHGNTTAYNATGSYAWPVLVMFGPSANATLMRNGAGVRPEIPESAAKLSCLRAKEAIAGGIVPGSGGTSDGNKVAVLSFMFVMVVFAVGLLM